MMRPAACATVIRIERSFMSRHHQSQDVILLINLLDTFYVTLDVVLLIVRLVKTSYFLISTTLLSAIFGNRLQ